VGIIVGGSTAVFLRLLDLSTSFSTAFPYYFVVLPLGMVLSVVIVDKFAPEAKGHGTERVIDAIHKRSGKIDPAVVPVKLVATIITIATGGSAGKEGPCAQIGAAMASLFASLLRFADNDRRKLVICGISAGFASVFGTPIAGAMFGVEVLVIGSLLYDVLLPSFIAGMVGYQAAGFFGVAYFHEPLRFVPVFSSLFMIKVCGAGLFFGLCSYLFIEVMRLFDKLAKKIQLKETVKAFIGALSLVGLSFAFTPRYLGLGLTTIKDVLEGRDAPYGAFFMKIVSTSITLGFGGSGGVVTPIFFIGATSGNLFARIFDLDPSVFAAIGMVSLLAGAANTPIAASIMSVELFGASVAPYAAVACVISFLMTGHRSIYPSQVLGTVKSASIKVREGQEMARIGKVNFAPRPKTLSGFLIRFAERSRKKKDSDDTGR
jgi:H+/Cl- antiporter ClcA